MDQIPASARIMAVPYPPRTVSHSWTTRGRRDLRPRGMAAGQTAVKNVREIWWVRFGGQNKQQQQPWSWVHGPDKRRAASVN